MTAEENERPKCTLCGEPMKPGEEMFQFHGSLGPCPRPPLAQRRTLRDAISETERLLAETFEQLDPENDRDRWFMVRITKILEAIADRPPEAVARDWRIGLSAKVKYRTHKLYYEPPHKVIDVFPSGHADIVDKDGVLKLESASGKVFLAPANDWQTA